MHTQTGWHLFALLCNTAAWTVPKARLLRGLLSGRNPHYLAATSEERSRCLLPNHWESLLQTEHSSCMHHPSSCSAITASSMPQLIFLQTNPRHYPSPVLQHHTGIGRHLPNRYSREWEVTKPRLKSDCRARKFGLCVVLALFPGP